MAIQSWSLVLLVVFCCQGNARRSMEPECTRFEYDVQLLEKMVRFEHKIEVMEERLKTCLQGWDAKETKLSSEIKTLSETLKTKQESLSESLKTEQEAKLQIFENTQSKWFADTKNQMNNYVNQKIDNIKGQGKTPSVYFHYYYAADEYLSTGEAMRFKRMVTDTHNAYSTTTGCFTVPVEGFYIFAMQLTMHTGKMINSEIHVNGKVYTYANFYILKDNTSTNMNIGIPLKPKDNVCVKAGSDTDSGDLIYNNNHQYHFLYGALVG